MHHVIYLSSASRLFDQAQLHDLLIQSRQDNEAAGITGVLVYKDGSFLQVIEGEKEAVTSLYDRIANDQRHRGLITLFNEAIPEREFPEWSMAFYDADASAAIGEGFNELLNQQSPEEYIEVFPAKVRAFLRGLVR